MICVLHVGLHKTGTSSIQFFLNIHRRELLQCSVNSFLCDKKNHSIPIVSVYSGMPERYIQNILNFPSIEIVEQRNKLVKNALFRQCSLNTSKYFVISGEDISLLEKDALVRLKKDLLQFFEKIVVIAYVREPVALVTSTINELHKTFGGNLSSYTEEVYSTASQLVSYRLRLEKFVKIFGVENIVCKNFSSSEFVGNNLILDFFKNIGVDAALDQFDLELYGNVATTKEGVFVTNLINKSISLIYDGETSFSHHPYTVPEAINVISYNYRSKLMSLVSNIPGDKFQLKGLSPDRLYECMRGDIEWLDSTFGIQYAPIKYAAKSEPVVPEVCNRFESIVSMLISGDAQNFFVPEPQDQHAKNIELLRNIDGSLCNFAFAKYIQILIYLGLNKAASDILKVYHEEYLKSPEFTLNNYASDELYLALGKIYYDIEDYHAVIEICSIPLCFPVNRSTQSILLSKAYNEIGERVMSIEAAYDAVCHDEYSFIASAHLGKMLFLSGYLKSAISAYLKAVSLNPTEIGLYYRLSKLYLQYGKLSYAMKNIEIAMSLQKNNFTFYFLRGKILFAGGDIDQAMNDFKIAIAIEPDSHESYFQLSHIYHKKNDFDRAIESATQAINRSTTNKKYIEHKDALVRLAVKSK